MTIINLLLGDPQSVTVDDLAQRLKALPTTHRQRPFSDELLQFAQGFSQLLLNRKETRAYPELQSLGFWLRASSLQKMRKEIEGKAATLIVPQGVVFHIPPANVDTMFAYSLFVSLLCGNANIIRLPSRRGPVSVLLLALLNEHLKSSPALQGQLLILGYEHDDAITKLICDHIDMRVLWGSNSTISGLRQIPLPAHAPEIIFSDRFSWSAIDTVSYESLADHERRLLAERYFNDLFWFDQNGCASPRVILWCGKDKKSIRSDFYKHLANIAQDKNWHMDNSGNLAKQTRQYEAMVDPPITEKQDFGSALTVFSLADLKEIQSLRENPCFGGTLFEVTLDALQEAVPYVQRSDQTLTHYGFAAENLRSFAEMLNGRGFDRIIPIGEALSFDTIWDGYDLLQHFTRSVRLKGAI